MLDSFNSRSVDQYRSYMRVLARLWWDPCLMGKVDPSDIVQETMLKAQQSLHQFRGTTEPEFLGWLRKILAGQLAESVRQFQTQKRNTALEKPLEFQGGTLAIDGQPSVPERLAELSELALELAVALDSLPDTQRVAMILHYWQGMSPVEIAPLIDKTPAAVAGLLRRGLEKLREQQPKWESHLS